jgi:hypothetical protein
LRSYQQAKKKEGEYELKIKRIVGKILVILKERVSMIERMKHKIKSIKHMHKENFDVLKIFDTTID